MCFRYMELSIYRWTTPYTLKQTASKAVYPRIQQICATLLYYFATRNLMYIFVAWPVCSRYWSCSLWWIPRWPTRSWWLSRTATCWLSSPEWLSTSRWCWLPTNRWCRLPTSRWWISRITTRLPSSSR